ncbi:MAG: S8 family serine peptidase, partial [Candidatus Pacearchaeota archaeon]
MKNKKKILLILIYSSILLSIIFLNPFEIIKAERNIENKTYLNEVDQEFNKGFNKIKVIVEVEEMQPKILGQLIFRDSIKIREKIIEDTRINKSIKHRFNSFNGFSAELTKEEIENLMREKKVKRISLVKKYKLFLEDSAPLINATQTWGVVINGVNLTGLGQTACIIDTGVDYNHSDLGNCFGNNNQSSSCKIIGGYDFCADDTACNTVDSDPMDVHGHGTNIAGIISANGSIKGIAPDSRIIMIKASNSSGIFFSDDLIAGIEWCVNNATIFNISVISMSLGSEDVYTTYCDNLNSQFTNAINSAVQK